MGGKYCESAINQSMSGLLDSVGFTLYDPLLSFKPWRRQVVAGGHRNLKLLRDFGNERVVCNLLFTFYVYIWSIVYI